MTTGRKVRVALHQRMFSPSSHGPAGAGRNPRVPAATTHAVIRYRNLYRLGLDERGLRAHVRALCSAALCSAP